MLTPEQKDRVLRFVRSLETRSFTFRDVVRHLDLESDERRSLQHYLDELDGQEVIHRVKRGRYALPSREKVLSGVISGHREGYGFVTPDPGSPYSQDIFIPPHGMEEAMHGDRVLIKVARKKRPVRRGIRGARAREEAEERLEGTVIRVLERRFASIVGRYYEHPRYPFIVPLDDRMAHEIRIPFHASKGAKNGQIVAAALTVAPGRNQIAQGRVIEILGYPGDSDLEYRIVEYKFGLPVQFSRAALEEAESLPDQVLAEEIVGREDLRDELMVTIDGEDARDFDDAVSLKVLPSGNYLLGVHIADVSYYVREGSELDREAHQRGTSVYFPDRAIPMLPARLSSGICSLLPREDRLAFSVLMEVDRQGGMIRHRFCPSVIRSHERMTYTAVAQILLARDAAAMKRYEALVPMFENMRDLCEILAAKRYRRGSIDFDLPEADIRFDEKGKIVSILPAERNIAHRIIEEFMLLANETVAARLAESGGPALYRVHEEPDRRKVAEFAEFSLALGYPLGSHRGEYTPQDFQEYVAQIEGKVEGRFLAYLMLRSFMQARYSEVNLGHFGLATEMYTHFTSPIRRYPDLVVHRLLKQCLRRSPSDYWQAGMTERLPAIALHTSARERVADEAEREIEKVKKVQFMSDKVGDEFEAIVFSVIRQGFFIELLEHFVEGFVPAGTLIDDRYQYKEKNHCFVGETRRRRYELGTRVLVRLDHADMETYRLTFSVVRLISPPARGRGPASIAWPVP
ncbi:MAG: ribonuclease R [Acidobacteria bacterium]|nr:ribonuclease R [Acidobacteriota bacterium]